MRACITGCGAWTHTAQRFIRLKAQAQHSLQVVSSAPGCFLPSYNFSQPAVSAVAQQQSSIKFAQLYIDRTSSWIIDENCGSHDKQRGRDCSFGHFGYASTLRVLPRIDEGLRVHVFGDRSIVELFGTDGRAVVTARVYPTLPSSDRLGLRTTKVLKASSWGGPLRRT